MFVPVSWTTGLFLEYFSFGERYAFQTLHRSSHLIILTPLLGSAIPAFFLKFHQINRPIRNSQQTRQKLSLGQKVQLTGQVSETEGLCFCAPLPVYTYLLTLIFSLPRLTLLFVLLSGVSIFISILKSLGE